jgi:protein-disulfide isomerase
MNAQARAARAATARAERERKARAAKMRNLAISIAVVVVLAIAAVIVIPRLHSSSSAKVVTPAGVVDYKGVHGAPFGPATAPVTITLFEDFQCPICLHLEQTSGAEFTKLANAGKIRIIYSMVSILDRESNGNAYSTRSASLLLRSAAESEGPARRVLCRSARGERSRSDGRPNRGDSEEGRNLVERVHQLCRAEDLRRLCRPADHVRE